MTTPPGETDVVDDTTTGPGTDDVTTVEPESCVDMACGLDPVTGAACGDCPAGETCNAAGQCEAPVVVDPACYQQGHTPTEEKIVYAQPKLAIYEGSAGKEGFTTSVTIQIFEDWAGGAVGPGTYDLTGINYADCANCVLVFENCNAQDCERRFYAESGTLILDTYGEGVGFKGTLFGVEAQEVTINSNIATSLTKFLYI